MAIIAITISEIILSRIEVFAGFKKLAYAVSFCSNIRIMRPGWGCTGRAVRLLLTFFPVLDSLDKFLFGLN